MNYLRQSTAASVKFGPFVDDTDGKTAETALTIQKADVRMSKNGGNMAATHSDQGASDVGAPHDELGVYDGSFDTTDTNTLGRLRVDIYKSGALAWWREWQIIPADVYDALVAGSIVLPVNTTQVEGVDASDKIGDSVLSRNVSNVEVGLGEHTLGTIVLFLLESIASGSTLTVHRTDGSTTHITKTLTTDPSAEPVIGVS